MAYEKVARTGTRSSPHVGELHLLRRRRTGASAGKANSGRGGDRASYAHLGNTHGHKSDHRHTGAERKLHGCAREGAGEKPGGEVASSWSFALGAEAVTETFTASGLSGYPSRDLTISGNRTPCPGGLLHPLLRR